MHGTSIGLLCYGNLSSNSNMISTKKWSLRVLLDPFDWEGGFRWFLISCWRFKLFTHTIWIVHLHHPHCSCPEAHGGPYASGEVPQTFWLLWELFDHHATIKHFIVQWIQFCTDLDAWTKFTQSLYIKWQNKVGVFRLRFEYALHNDLVVTWMVIKVFVPALASLPLTSGNFVEQSGSIN